MIKQYESEPPKNIFEWNSAYSEFTKVQKDEDKFVYDYFFDSRNEIDLPEEVEEYRKYHREQSNFWNFVRKLNRGETETFQISPDIKVQISFPERKPNTDIEL